MEIKSALGWPAVFACGYFLALVLFLLQSDGPRNLFYLNEMAMCLLVVFTTYVWFQREIGGGMMEMLGTFPISFTGMIGRKLLLVHLTVLVCHYVLMGVYVWRLGPLRTVMFPWDGGAPFIRTTSWWELYGQALPGYFVIAALTVFGFTLTKHVFGGVGFAVAYWMFEGLTAGGTTQALSLYTAYLPDGASFPLNRLLLAAIGGLLLVTAAGLLQRRSRWIAAESDA